mgnify:CR=1 FL=1
MIASCADLNKLQIVENKKRNPNRFLFFVFYNQKTIVPINLIFLVCPDKDYSPFAADARSYPGFNAFSTTGFNVTL